MEKRSSQRVRDQVAQLAFEGRSQNETERARISMVARNTNVPFKGRIQMRKTNHLQIVIFGLQRAAGPYRWAMSRHCCMTLRDRMPTTSADTSPTKFSDV